MNNQERIICAAIWWNNPAKPYNLPYNLENGICIGGWRHANCISSFACFYPNWEMDSLENENRLHFLNNHVQGFLTSKGNFVDREEGMKLAIKAGQVPFDNTTSKLYSEDLY